MAEGTTEIDALKYREMMNALVRELPAGLMGEVLRIEAKELIRRVLSFLPPKTQSQGRKAVARDVGHTMRALDPRTFSDPTIKKILLSGDVAAIQRLVDVTPGFAGMIVQLFQPSIHTSRRTGYGRVSSSTPPALIPQPDLVKSYTREVQNRVGLLKSGYGPAAAQLGLSIPGWVSKHAGGSLGSINFEGSGGTIAKTQLITIVHRSGKWPDHPRVVRDAMSYRVEAMKTKVGRLVSGKWVNLGGSIGRVGG